jgi:putative transposase
MTARTADGRVLRILNIIHEYTRQCLATLVKWRTTSEDVVDQLFNLFIFKAIPEHIRSDNGPEFTAQAIRR